MPGAEPTITLGAVNAWPEADVTRFLTGTLFSEDLAAVLVKRRPFRSVDELAECAAAAWTALPDAAKRVTFNAHPRIGDISEVRKRQYSRHEQQSIFDASPELLRRFSELNDLYEQKFGYRFLVVASGKTAAEMMSVLELRLENAPADEFLKAGLEKLRINDLRIRRVVRPE